MWGVNISKQKITLWRGFGTLKRTAEILVKVHFPFSPLKWRRWKPADAHVVYSIGLSLSMLLNTCYFRWISCQSHDILCSSLLLSCVGVLLCLQQRSISLKISLGKTRLIGSPRLRVNCRRSRLAKRSKFRSAEPRNEPGDSSRYDDMLHHPFVQKKNSKESTLQGTITYPPKRHFWRWFSFSWGGICQFPGG